DQNVEAARDPNAPTRERGTQAEQRENDRQERRDRRMEERGERMAHASSAGGPETRFPVGRLNPRESRTVTVRGVATATGQIFNCASATYDMYACLGTRVIQPELRVSAKAPDADLCTDDTISLTMMVANTGSGATDNVVVDAQYPTEI